jgi:serine/threonine-protein kinase RsbW
MDSCAVTEVKVASSPVHLPRVRKIITCFARSLGMSEQEEHDTKLAVTEAFANAIRHGSPDGDSSSVILRLFASDHTIVAEITDEGAGFDPASLHPRETFQPGGMGIPLMRALTDDVEFERNRCGMTIRIRKKASRK